MIAKMRDQTSLIDIHRDGVWLPAAELRALGPDRCRIDYLPDYVFGAADPWPVSLRLPVGVAPDRYVAGPSGLEPDRSAPGFLYDLVPQGKGRRYLLAQLQLQDDERLVVPLVMAGAFNPIGCLRLQSAVTFFAEHARRNPDPASTRGFAWQDLQARSADVLDHLSMHAMLASGTTGVQGVAPKFLLSTDADGRWFADMALPDDRAQAHWLLKLPRGPAPEDRTVLRNEAAYLRLAAACGLRTGADPQLHGDMLLLRRFDRQVQAGRVLRLHQESLASLADLRGFGIAANQHHLLGALRAVVSDPFAETLEFLRRDVLNLAMRNTDNHARNTAVQRLPDGRVQLTPLFDFAPMFLDGELIARSCHWRDSTGRVQDDWRQVIETLDVPDAERRQIAAALLAFAEVVAGLPETAARCGVETAVIDACRPTIDRQCEQLAALSALRPASGRSA